MVTRPIKLLVGFCHTEEIELMLILCPAAKIILGHPWLQKHNPIIDWKKGDIVSWGDSCSSACLSIPVRAVAQGDGQIPPQYSDYLDVFSKSSADHLPPHREYDCAINLLPDAKLPKGRLFSLSRNESKAMEEYIEENLKKGFIRPSKSPVGAGFFFVNKKDGSLRPCIDYRGLNKITVRNSYPLPLITDLFDQLKGARIFTKIDLRGAYNLVRIREGDEWKTAFNTNTGHYEYLVMPFGLCNAPAVFQDLINDVLRDFLGKFVVVYLDDILIYSPSLEVHRSQVHQVLQRLRENHLYAKAEKCEFEVLKVTFLGYVISPQGFAMDPEKVRAILDWVQPRNLKAVQRFQGFSNYYRRFIKGFSVQIAPISDLTKKGADPENWKPVAIKAFADLKKAFTTAPVLRHPNPELPFLVEVDASDVGAGAILSQRDPGDGKVHPCAFFSKKFSPAERNYDVGNRELLAIKLAFEEWRQWLEGAIHPITVYTDHKNLAYIESAKRLNPRQARWALFFTRFQFVITYRPGALNKKADALSRSFMPVQDAAVTPQPIVPPSLIRAGLTRDLRSLILEAQGERPAEGPRDKLFVPTQLRKAALTQAHSTKTAGHLGVAKTLELLRRSVWWSSLSQDVEEFVGGCEVCARNKTIRAAPTGPLHPLPVAKRPWTHLSMDFITELPVSSNCSCIWVVVDRFSKMAHFIPLRNLPSAQELARLFAKHIVRLHGLPVDIVSDRGPQFIAKFWRTFCKGLGILVSLSSGYHPQTNGQTERVNQSLEQYLRCFTSKLQDNWVENLSWAEFAYNNAWHSSTRMSPFFCVQGFHPRYNSLDAPGDDPEGRRSTAEVRATWRKVNQTLRELGTRIKQRVDLRRTQVKLKVGDWVWLSTKNIKLRQPSFKLGPRFIGPYKIVKKINPVAFRLLLPKNLRIPNVFHVSLLKPVRISSRFGNRPPSRPAPVLVDGVQEYEVESILDSKWVQGQVHYLIHWKGFGPEERSWIPARDVHAEKLVKLFHSRFPNKPKWRGH